MLTLVLTIFWMIGILWVSEYL